MCPAETTHKLGPDRPSHPQMFALDAPFPIFVGNTNSMGPSSQFSTKVPQRSQHFYGFSMIVQIVFTAVGETKNEQENQK